MHLSQLLFITYIYVVRNKPVQCVLPSSKPKAMTYFAVLSNNISQNVDCHRCLYHDNDDIIEWSNYLTELSNLYPGVVSACCVCFATLDKVHC